MWLVTLVLAVARSSTLRLAGSLRLVRRVVRAVVIWRLRRRVGIRVVVLIQAFSGLAAGVAGSVAGSVAMMAAVTSPVLRVPRLVLVLRTLPRLWRLALMMRVSALCRLPELPQPTLRLSVV